MSSFVSEGRTVDFTLGGTVAAYVTIAMPTAAADALVGVTQAAGVSGDVVAVAIVGEHYIEKKATEVWVVGDPLYLDGTALTTTKGTDPYAGRASKAAASADVVGYVVLSGANGLA